MYKKKKLLIVFGTRPEFIKLLPIILYLNSNKKIRLIICNSSQHKDLIKPFLKFYNINIDHDLNVLKKGQSLSLLSAQLIKKFDRVVKKIKPDCVIVQGDTSTSFIGSLTAFYNHVKIFHIEAGLRTYNIFSPWPEEINRQFISKLSSHHFAPTQLARENLIKEGFISKDITLTGNTVIDLLFITLNSINKNKLVKSNLQKKFNYIDKEKFKILISVHRRENFGKPLKEIFESINEIAKNKDFQIIYCIHTNPNVINSSKKYLKKSSNIIQIKSLNYIEFIYMMNEVDFIMSDSGGIQEEAPSLGKPNIILREYTERPEAINEGSAILVSLNKKSILNNFNNIYKNKKKLQSMSVKRNIYGNGNSAKIISEKIIRILDN